MKKRFLAALLSAALLIGTCMPVYATSGTGSSEIPPEAPVEEEVVEPQEPVCTCPDEEGVDKTAEGYVHQEGCPKYVAPETPNDSKEPEEPVCTCPDVEGVDKTAEDYVHQEGCPLYQAPEEPKQPALSQRELTSNEPSVKVSGMIPEDVELVVTEMPMMATYSLDDEESSFGGFGDRILAALDISMFQGENEWQPAEGQPVTVTMNADELGLENGDYFFVYHIHENEDGDVTEEWLGPFQAANDEAVFEMSGFSYVILVNGEEKITNVQSFYKVSGDSGNDQYSIFGVYYDTNGVPHILLKGKKATTPAKNIKGVMIGKVGDQGAIEIKIPTSVLHEKVLKLELSDSSDENIEIYNSVETWFYDIKLNDSIEISQEFYLSIADNSGKYTGNNFGILNVLVKVTLNYDVQKTVYQVNDTVITDAEEQENATVHPGDEVIFKIVATNSTDSEMNITGASLIDTLPDGVFDLTSVRYGTDLNSLSSVSSTNTNKEITLANANLTLAAGASETYYVKATVLDDLDVPAEGSTYTNTATLSGGNANIKDEDTASVTVTPPPKGDLVITKIAEQIPDQDQSFVFTITGPDSFKMQVVIKGAGSITIKDLAPGNYTVTETGWSWRYTPETATQTKEVKGGEIATVTFINTLTTPNWLSGSGYCKNQWSNKGATINGSTPADN